MQKTLACKWATTLIARFDAEDIANLVPDAKRSTISDVINEMLAEGVIVKSGESKAVGRGRPRIEYRWLEGKQEAFRASLNFRMASVDALRSKFPHWESTEKIETFEDTASVIRELVDLAMGAVDLEERTKFVAVARAEFSVMKNIYVEKLKEIEGLLMQLEAPPRESRSPGLTAEARFSPR